MGVAREASRQVPSSEPALIRAAQGGDRAAFALLVEEYWDRLYRWLFQITHDRHQAEDLTQESFLKAFAHLNGFTAGTNFRAWLFRIAHNTFANQHRGKRRRSPLPEDLPDRSQGPLEQAQSQEVLAEVAQAVRLLPPDFKAALLLRIEEGLSFRQIAEILDTTEETARWRVFKARQQLLGYLGSQEEPEEP